MTENTDLNLWTLLETPPEEAPGAVGWAPPADSFAAQGRLPGASLMVEVEGLGALPQPLSPEQALALHAASEPAAFGLREQTLVDAAVRHTGEISADLLGLSWVPGAFAGLEQTVAAALGVERLEAHLHNLLIYGPGQFFKPHQDTEKHPRMVATLVLIWPSAHLGGELRVQQGERELALASQQLHEADIRWFAFYADCRHEVLPVQEGWRVALTFDLVLPAALGALASAGTPDWQAAVQEALQDQFALDTTLDQRPWVLLLDHEYTEHGLRWGLLKGADRWRVGALRAAAQALGYSLHLALAEIQESWTALPPEYSRRGQYEPVEPDELIEDSLSLNFWVDAQDQLSSHQSLLLEPTDAACYIATGPEFRIKEEYEGYMGNYGETLDYWYRRAALVIQSPQAAEANRFKLDFAAALADTLALARQPDESRALLRRVRSAAESLAGQLSGQGRALLAAYAELAAALPDADTATTLMQGFAPSGFLPPDAAVLAELEQAQGTAWMRELLQRWVTPERPAWAGSQLLTGGHVARPTLWPADLPAFTQACLDANLSPALLDDWFTAHRSALVRFDSSRDAATPAHRQALQAGSIDALLALTRATLRLPDEGESHLRPLLAHVASQPQLYPPLALAPWVQALTGATQPVPQAIELRQQVIAALQTVLVEPPRAPSDHRLRSVEWTCRCQDCLPVVQWAESPDSMMLILPLAEQRRRHVQEQVEKAGAGLALQLRKQGSPYQLLLNKPGDLHARDQAARERWERDLAGLMGA